MIVQNDDRLTTLTLLNLEIIGASIGILGLSVLIITSYKSKTVLYYPYLKNSSMYSTVNLDKAAFIGRLLLVTAGFIAACTTTVRLFQRIQMIMRNESLNGSINPNIWLTIGIWTSFAGGMAALVGDYKRVQETTSTVPIQ